MDQQIEDANIKFKHVAYGNKKSINIPDNATLQQLPVLSTYANVSPYFGIVFEDRLVIPPHSETSVYVNIPVDTGIFVLSEKKYKQIDTVENWPKKFSLYGSASDGMVYRYFKTGYFHGLPKPEANKISTKVGMINRHGKWFVITKFIFSYPSFNIFSHKGRNFGEAVEIDINNEDLALVSLKNKPSFAGAKPMSHIKQGYSNTIEMRYGT